MPYINAKTNMKVSPDQEEALRTALDEAFPKVCGRLTEWFMINIEDDCCTKEKRLFAVVLSKDMGQNYAPEGCQAAVPPGTFFEP